MPRNFELLDLITRGRRRCDQENRDLLSAAEWKEEASTIKSEFDGILIDSGMRMFEKRDTFTTVAGTSDYQVPSDFLVMVGVDWKQGDGQWIELEPMLAQERNFFTGSANSGQSTAYELIGYTITLQPEPSGAQEYRIVYVPQPPDISTAPDVTIVDVVTPAGEAFFTWSLALVGGVKEADTDMVRLYEGKIQQYRTQVIEWATQRELYTPKRRFVHSSYSSYNNSNGGHLPGDYNRG